MNYRLRGTIKIFFSKAVILTYIFICYSAITHKDRPVCSVDSTLSFSVNDVAYPSALVIQITSADHIRPAKESSHHITFLPVRKIEIYLSYTSWVRLDAHETVIQEKNLSRPRQSRAPPVAECSPMFKVFFQTTLEA
ncbi:hypothetical protein JNM05_11420 [bacterium]|nr:hypothetical protein [bacterium]